MKKLVLVVLAVLVVVLAASYFGPEHQRFLAFKADRDAWHRRCDIYKTAPIRPDHTDAAQACDRQLHELLAYASQQGWN